MEDSPFRGIPPFVYGTAFKGDQTATLTEKALSQGFLGVDCAAISRNYNEKLAGQGISKAVATLQLTREQLFVRLFHAIFVSCIKEFINNNTIRFKQNSHPIKKEKTPSSFLTIPLPTSKHRSSNQFFRP